MLLEKNKQPNEIPNRDNPIKEYPDKAPLEEPNDGSNDNKAHHRCGSC